MANRQQDERALNQLLHEAWPGIADILQAEITHRVAGELNRLPGRMSRRRTSIDLSATPGFSLTGLDRIELRLPAQGAIRFVTSISLFNWLPILRMRVEIDLAITILIHANREPVIEIDMDISSDWLGKLLDRRFHWENEIRNNLDLNEIRKELGYLSVTRYAPDNVPSIPSPVPVEPGRPVLRNGISIVLVPEGFTDREMHQFDSMARDIMRSMTTPDERHRNEPFANFRTAFNFWTITPDQTPGEDYILGSFVDPRGHRRVAFGNLARLAAIRRKAEQTESETTIIVVIINPQAPRFEGQRPPAMALGNLIMQPLRASPELNSMLLLHELGHTTLARLGDEYVLRNRANETYLGKPPRPPNQTSDASLEKWQRWIDEPQSRPAWDRQQIVGVEGAGYFGRRIWRPAEHCAMRSSIGGIPFCAVCRESLTNGIRKALGEDRFLFRLSGVPGVPNEVEILVSERRRAVYRVTVPENDADNLCVSPVAGTLPEPWRIDARMRLDGDIWNLRGDSCWDIVDSPSASFTIPAIPGAALVLDVQSGCVFTPWDPLPRFSIEFLVQESQPSIA